MGKEFFGGGHAEGTHGCAIGCEHSLTALGTEATMDLRNVPYRSDVLTWNPDDLAEYFRTVSLALFCFCLMEEQTAVTLVGLNSDILWWAKLAAELKAKPLSNEKLSSTGQ